MPEVELLARRGHEELGLDDAAVGHAVGEQHHVALAAASASSSSMHAVCHPAPAGWCSPGGGSRGRGAWISATPSASSATRSACTMTSSAKETAVILVEEGSPATSSAVARCRLEPRAAHRAGRVDHDGEVEGRPLRRRLRRGGEDAGDQVARRAGAGDEVGGVEFEVEVEHLEFGGFGEVSWDVVLESGHTSSLPRSGSDEERPDRDRPQRARRRVRSPFGLGLAQPLPRALGRASRVVLPDQLADSSSESCEPGDAFGFVALQSKLEAVPELDGGGWFLPAALPQGHGQHGGRAPPHRRASSGRWSTSGRRPPGALPRWRPDGPSRGRARRGSRGWSRGATSCRASGSRRFRTVRRPRGGGR